MQLVQVEIKNIKEMFLLKETFLLEETFLTYAN